MVKSTLVFEDPASRLLVMCGGGYRQILRIFCYNDGGLLLSLPTTDQAFDTRKAEIAKAVRGRKFSIHPSNRSIDKINLIKHTINYADGTAESSVHITRAFKRTNRFAPIFYRIMSNPLNREAVESKNITDHVLGKIDPFFFVMIYAIFVRNSTMLCPAPFTIGSRQIHVHKIGNYDILCIRTYLRIPSTAHGFLYIIETADPKEINSAREYYINERDMNGYLLEQCVMSFDKTCEIMLRKHVDHAREIGIEVPSRNDNPRTAEWCSYGSPEDGPRPALYEVVRQWPPPVPYKFI